MSSFEQGVEVCHLADFRAGDDYEFVAEQGVVAGRGEVLRHQQRDGREARREEQVGRRSGYDLTRQSVGAAEVEVYGHARFFLVSLRRAR